MSNNINVLEKLLELKSIATFDRKGEQYWTRRQKCRLFLLLARKSVVATFSKCLQIVLVVINFTDVFIRESGLNLKSINH